MKTQSTNEVNLLTPILVGCGDLMDDFTPIETARSPYDLIAQSAQLAIKDTGCSAILQSIDTVAVLRSYADTSHRFATKLGGSSNPPKSIADRLGIHPKRYLYTWNGGNMPQYLVNYFSELISKAEMKTGLIVGGEALRTQHGVERSGMDVSWKEDPGGEPELIGDPRKGWNDYEDRHGMRAAITMYPLFENSIRGSRASTPDAHLEDMAKLMEHFAKVAQSNPLATRREGWSAKRLATIDGENRWIGYPYPRYMVSNAYIDQAASFIITSVGEAEKLGIDPAKWIFLHGCADAHDHWYTSERFDLHSSPAMKRASELAFSMAGKSIDDIDILDVYSCFPSAVEIACKELGIAEDDPRGLTVTGGLVYFGGPGNSYVVLSIVEMMRRLRSAPGKFGLVTANGNWVTKHAYGIYSTTPVMGEWKRQSPTVLQDELDKLPKASLTETPLGRAKIETYTVMFNRSVPSYAVIFGRLLDTGERFIANTEKDLSVLSDLLSQDALGRLGTVVSDNGINIFTLDKP